MSTDTSASKPLDVHQIVTDRILALFQQGIVPWKTSWDERDIPTNLMSKRPYRGINLWLLHSLNYERNLFLTWKQVKEIGASVKRGENGHVVVYSKPVRKPATSEAGKEIGSTRLLYYKVFNISQCAELPSTLVPAPEARHEDPIHQCEVIIEKMLQSPTIRHRGQKPIYDGVKDILTMPSRKSYGSDEAYYATLFHQLIHSTAAENRLKRTYESEKQQGPLFDPYLMEEVVAEIGAAQLCGFAGIPIPQPENGGIYIAGFTELLKGNNKFMVRAAGYAQMAVDFILNRSSATEEAKEAKEATEHAASQEE